MEELERILRLHAEKYRHMQPTDAVKLIYQNEFGGGHLINDEAACLAYLRQEYESVIRSPEVAVWEPIGNNIIRVQLAALDIHRLDQLGHAFIASAAVHTGTQASFFAKLEVVRNLAQAGIFPFDALALDTYLAGYRDAGFPPVSHSESYRQHYKPAYRVVRKDFWDVE